MEAIQPALKLACTDKVQTLRAEYHAKGRVQIIDALEMAWADAIYASLAAQKQWNLVYTQNGTHVDSNAAAIANWPAAKRKKLEKVIYAQARNQFQYYYAAIPIYDIYHQNALPGHFLNDVVEFLNSSECLDLIRSITADESIAFADAQATGYGPGHFLTCHDDNMAGKNRRVAYVLNLTPLWSIDWGGALQFVNELGNIEEAYTPRYNALNLFRVPTDHSVSIVAPFAGGVRYSITGWFRSGKDAEI